MDLSLLTIGMHEIETSTLGLVWIGWSMKGVSEEGTFFHVAPLLQPRPLAIVDTGEHPCQLGQPVLSSF